MEPPAPPDPAHVALLERLEALVHKHLLIFRLEVGRAVIDELFDGDLDAWRDRSGHKAASLKRFAAENAERLETLGLDEVAVRRSVQAWSVVFRLGAIAEQLEFSHAAELARVEDAQTREHLARATVDNGWSVRDLIAAVKAVKQGRWIDGDPGTHGLQPPAPVPPPEPVPPSTPARPLPGRVLSRVERSAADFAAQIDVWDAVPVERLTPVQRARVSEALDLIEERARRLRARLGDGSPR